MTQPNQQGIEKLKANQIRQDALHWWDKFPTTEKARVARSAYPGRYALGLSSTEIESLYIALTKK